MEIKISEKIKKTQVDKADKIAEILIRVLKAESKEDRAKEHFWGVYLNARNVIIRVELIHLGTLNACLCHPRDTFLPAISSAAASLIVLHNHPSGDIDPSEDDIKLTKRLVEAGKILGIELIDHIIIDESGEALSFRDKKLIE